MASLTPIPEIFRWDHKAGVLQSLGDDDGHGDPGARCRGVDLAEDVG
jgi:hypothetical protein